MLIVSAILPVLVFLYFIYRKDTDKEPPKLLFKSFLWGCLATLPILFFEIFISQFNIFRDGFLNSFYEAFMVAAFVEEGMKFLVLYALIWRNKDFNQFYDGIVYAVFVSLGFAMIENISYVLSNGFTVAVTRAVLAIPGHGLFGVIMGYFFAIAKFSGPKKQFAFLWLSFLAPLLFHGLYDFILFYIRFNAENTLLVGILNILFITLIVILWRTGLRDIKRLYEKDFSRNTISNPED